MYWRPVGARSVGIPDDKRHARCTATCCGENVHKDASAEAPAYQLVASSDLMLLDQPTNRLDIDAIGWLENFLNCWAGSIVFETFRDRPRGD